MFNLSVHKTTYRIPDEFIGAEKLDNEACIFSAPAVLPSAATDALILLFETKN